MDPLDCLDLGAYDLGVSEPLNQQAHLLNESEAAEFLRLSKRTLQGWRSKRRGPRYVKLGEGPQASVVYRLEDLKEFVDHFVQQTNEGGTK